MSIGIIAAAPAVANQDPTGKVHKAAEDFAAVALNELLSPMFETVDNSGDLFGGGAGEQTFKPMLVQTFKPMLVNEFAKQIAHAGALGIAEPVYQQMLRLQEKSR